MKKKYLRLSLKLKNFKEITLFDAPLDVEKRYFFAFLNGENADSEQRRFHGNTRVV